MRALRRASRHLHPGRLRGRRIRGGGALQRGRPGHGRVPVGVLQRHPGAPAGNEALLCRAQRAGVPQARNALRGFPLQRRPPGTLHRPHGRGRTGSGVSRENGTAALLRRSRFCGGGRGTPGKTGGILAVLHQKRKSLGGGMRLQDLSARGRTLPQPAGKLYRYRKGR